MGKKKKKKEEEAASKSAAPKASRKSAPIEQPAPVSSPVLAPPEVKTVKAKATKAAKPAAKKPAAKKTAAVEIPYAEIELRAYYIAEKRQRDGILGDSSGDWIEAERQLRAELAPKKRKASAK